MESNQVEARNAMEVAERKLSGNDYVGAKKVAEKAQNLYPELDGLKQVLMMIDVYISAGVGGGGEADWYGILGVDRLADDETVKKQYKKLALLLHPDKNKFHGTEESFKLVSELWCVLSDKDKRSSYDQKRKAKQRKTWKRQQKKEAEPGFDDYNWNQYEKGEEPGFDDDNWNQCEKEAEQGFDNDNWNQYEKEEQEEAFYDYWTSGNAREGGRRGSNKRSCPEKVRNFWTACKRCKTYCGFETTNCLNKKLSCPNCGQDFVATEIATEMVDGRLVFRFSSPHDSQESDSTNQEEAGGKVNREIEELAAAT